MRWKWIFACVVFLAIALLVTVYTVLATYDYNKLKPQIARMVKDATGRELNLRGDVDFVMGYPPALTVTDATFGNASWGSQPQMISVEKLSLEMRLLPLLVRDVVLRHVGLSGVGVLLETGPNGKGNWDFYAERRPKKKTATQKPLEFDIGHISIENLRLAYRRGPGGPATRYTIDRLDVTRQEAVDRLAVDLQARYNGHPLTVRGRTGVIRGLQSPQNFPVDLAGTFSDAQVEITGMIEDIFHLQGLRLKTHASGTDLAALGLSKRLPLPETSAFDVTGLLQGSKEALSLEDLIGKFSGSGIDLAVSGNVGDVFAWNAIDLKLNAAGKDLSAIGSIIGQKLPATDQFAFAGHLKGASQSLLLDEAQASANRGSVKVVLSGEVKDLLNLSGLDLQLNASGKNFAEMGAIIGAKLPVTEDFAVEGRLEGSPASLSLNAAQGRFEKGRLNLSVNGQIQDLLTFSGLDLNMKGSGTDLVEMGKILHIDLPATDRFAVQGRLSGSHASLSLQQAKASAERGRLRVNFDGEVKDLLNFSGLDLHVKGSGGNLAEMTPIVGKALPATDNFTVAGRLKGSTKALRLDDAQGQAKQGRLNLKASGQIRNLLNFSGVDLEVNGSGADLAAVGKMFAVQLPETTDFAVQGRLTGSARSLSLQKAQGRATRSGLRLTLSGGIEALQTLNGINLKVEAAGRELAAIGPLVGTELPELGPFEMTANLAGSAKAFTLSEFSATVDNSDFRGGADVALANRPRITARLASSVIDFTRLMKNREENEKKPVEKGSQPRLVFPDEAIPFETFKKVDADIMLKARNIHAREARLEFGYVALKLADGDLRIDRLEATYKETKISGNLHINAGVPTAPDVACNFLVQGFDLGAYLKETRRSDKVEAVVDIAAYGKSTGNSGHQLMANFNGAIGAVMGKGYLSNYLDMLSLNLSQKVLSFWDWARRRRKKADQINCAVVQFDIKEGVATSRAFVFDSQLAVLTGEGSINLGTEEINFLLVPNAKDPSLSLSTKLWVQGSILDPKVSPDKLSLLTQGSWALSSLAIGPLGLLAPFVHLGAHKAHPCDVPGIGMIGQGSLPQNANGSP